MSVDEALALADLRRGTPLYLATTEGTIKSEDTLSPFLADEVRRLREEVERWKQLCDVRSNTAAARKLARVEEWYARTTTSDPDELCEAMDELGNKILLDKQT